MGNIKELSKEINKINHEKGFWDNGIDIPQKLMFIVSEVSEAMEADRKDKSSSYYGMRDSEGNLYEGVASDELFEAQIKDTYEDELADVAIRLFDLAYEQGIDLEFHIKAKMNYNSNRPHMHGGKKY